MPPLRPLRFCSRTSPEPLPELMSKISWLIAKTEKNGAVSSFTDFAAKLWWLFYVLRLGLFVEGWNSMRSILWQIAAVWIQASRPLSLSAPRVKQALRWLAHIIWPHTCPTVGQPVLDEHQFNAALLACMRDSRSVNPLTIMYSILLCTDCYVSLAHLHCQIDD